MAGMNFQTRFRFANNYTNHLPVFPIAQVKKPQRSPTAPAFFDLHTRKNILENLHRNFKYGVLVLPCGNSSELSTRCLRPLHACKARRRHHYAVALQTHR